MEQNKSQVKLSKNEIKDFVLNIVLFVVGVLFLVLPQTMLNIVETVVCVALLIYAGFYLLSYCVVSMDTKDVNTLIKAVIALVFGLLILYLRLFFIISIGALLALSSVIEIIRCKKKRDDGKNVSSINFAVSAFFFVAGVCIVVLAGTKVATNIVMWVIGITLILNAIVKLIEIFFGEKIAYWYSQKIESKQQSKEDDFVDFEVKNQEDLKEDNLVENEDTINEDDNNVFDI